MARDSTPPPAGPPPKSFQTPIESLIVPGGSGIGPERALERRHPDPPSRDSAKAPPVPTFPASAGLIPRSPHPRPNSIARPAPQPPPKNLNPSTKRKPKRQIPKDRQVATHHARTGGSGIGPERALERRHPDPPSRDSAKAPPVPTFPASAGPIPRSHTRDSAPIARPTTQPHTQNSPDHPL